MTPRGRLVTRIAVCAVLLAAGGIVLRLLFPPLMIERVSVPDIVAIASLRMYLAGQCRFAKERRYGVQTGRLYANPVHGRGLPDLYQMNGPDSGGQLLEFIERDFAEAVAAHRPKCGYFYVDIVGDGNRLYDFSKDCGLCAVPAEWNVTGRNTYIINVTGKVYQKDNGGRPVTIWPDVQKQGWIPVGSE